MKDFYFELPSTNDGRVRRSKIKNQDKGLEGLGTKRCFSIRSPRTITTAPSSYDQDEDFFPLRSVDKKGEHSGPSLANSFDQSGDTSDTSDLLLKHSSPQQKRGFTNERIFCSSASGDERYESLSSPKNDSRKIVETFSPQSKSDPSEKDQTPGCLLSMPISKDRSHRRRLQEERGGVKTHTYQGEQEVAGYRGQEAQIQKDSALETPYLQFSVEGPALRVFESSFAGQRVQKKESNNSSIDLGSTLNDEKIRITERIQNKREGIEQTLIRPEKMDNLASTKRVNSNHSHPYVLNTPILRTLTRNSGGSKAVTQKNLDNKRVENSAFRFQKPKCKTMIDRDTIKNSNSYITPKKSIQKKIREGGNSLASTVQQTLGFTEKKAPLKLLLMKNDPFGDSINGENSSITSTSTSSTENLNHIMEDILQDFQPTTRPNNNNSNFETGNIVDVYKLSKKAQSYVQRGEYDLALISFERVMTMYRKVYGKIHPLVACTYHNLGIVHSHRADLSSQDTSEQNLSRQQALKCFQSAARIARDTLGENHPNVAASLVKTGFLLLHSGRYKAARTTFEEALRIRLNYFENDPNLPIANLYNNMGICELHLQNFPNSNKYLNKALEIQRHILYEERSQSTEEQLRSRLLEIADTLSNLGGLGMELISKEGPEENIVSMAEAQFEESNKIRSSILGSYHPLTIQAKNLYQKIKLMSH